MAAGGVGGADADGEVRLGGGTEITAAVLAGGLVEATAVELGPPKPKKLAMAAPSEPACAGAAVLASTRADPAMAEIKALETL
jgi:hypothetical protein